MDADLLAHARQWIAGGRAENPAWDATSDLRESPAGHVPRTLSWVVEDANRMAQVVLWEDGQSETDLADSETGEVRTQSRLLSGPPDVDDLLNTVRDWLRPA
ncbi:hypothetical protein OWR29_40750 [Actinoplanes sp. Pm04-4]|uniref:Uncharacterized protein n=1 Tax=Paractinoplanes pyxinae TaxID=2997416 RepID=A0ABT4BCX6_9ACTN|nr:hypothetical protein [Actinoplanes pyxinae]MCY1144363.1 hypothetical protein [Actinoplanes pyxinae]